jgi:uncharacterized protein (DUF1684 family)
MVQRSSGAIMALTCALSIACTSGPGPVDDSKHHGETAALRSEKDMFFRGSPDSPLLEADRASFAGLTYYDIRPEYRVPAWLTVDRSGPPVVIELQTSTNQKRRMRKVGALGFTLAGTALKLTAFAESETQLERLFVPFGDLTNNKDTYGGGRYLDLSRTPTGLYDLDFNRAYHPYCVFNPTYDCPVPPYENRLLIPIPAGERLAAPPKLRP